MFNVWPNLSQKLNKGERVVPGHSKFYSQVTLDHWWHHSGSIDFYDAGTGRLSNSKKKVQHSYRREKMNVLRFQTITASFLSLKEYKEDSKSCCKSISYPFLSLTYSATLTSGLYPKHVRSFSFCRPSRFTPPRLCGRIPPRRCCTLRLGLMQFWKHHVLWFRRTSMYLPSTSAVRDKLKIWNLIGLK